MSAAVCSASSQRPGPLYTEILAPASRLQPVVSLLLLMCDHGTALGRCRTSQMPTMNYWVPQTASLAAYIMPRRCRRPDSLVKSHVIP